ncbi:MAG: hypothetical protein D6773_02355 [Alphaproteobacteria bacterium]|nr:MAG: hypothetical protein D6773_02355 [Alphaproteobacteria bacterium]
MQTQNLEKSAWATYFDHVSKLLEGKQTEVEVAALAIGDQIEAEHSPLLGITYDRKDDLIEVALEGLDHLINHPREVYVAYGADGLEAVEIVDAEGNKQIVKLRNPLMLPKPEKIAS